MQPGQFDRKITIQVNTPTQDASGQPIDSWGTFASPWAKKMDIRGDERFATNQDLAVRVVKFRLYWLDGVHERMRIDDGGVIYDDILAIAGDERANWMEITAQARNPETS